MHGLDGTAALATELVLVHVVVGQSDHLGWIVRIDAPVRDAIADSRCPLDRNSPILVLDQIFQIAETGARRDQGLMEIKPVLASILRTR